MIAVRMAGGLGNQMFQYAAALALSRRLGVVLRLDVREFENYSLHGFGLDRWSVSAAPMELHEMRRFPESGRRLALSLYRRFGLKTRFYVEPGFEFDSGWLALGDGLQLNGYFQSEKYFSGIRDILLQEFVPLEALDGLNGDIFSAARAANSISIHVRRGDYISNPETLRIHGICSLDYYRAAIAHFRALVVTPRFFVFSNDIAWARENLPLGEDAVYVEGNEQSPEVDIFLMANCRHHVIANSSFSWWGAWLCNMPGQQVVTPFPWFNAPDMPAPDLLPAHWVKLKK